MKPNKIHLRKVPETTVNVIIRARNVIVIIFVSWSVDASLWHPILSTQPYWVHFLHAITFNLHRFDGSGSFFHRVIIPEPPCGRSYFVQMFRREEVMLTIFVWLKHKTTKEHPLVLGMFLLSFLIVFCELVDWIAAEDKTWVGRVLMSRQCALVRHTAHDWSKQGWNKNQPPTQVAGGTLDRKSPFQTSVDKNRTTFGFCFEWRWVCVDVLR